MPDKNTTPKCDHIPILEGDKVQKKKEKEKKKVSEPEKPDTSRSSGSKNRRSSDNFLRVLKRARKLRLRRPLRNLRW